MNDALTLDWSAVEPLEQSAGWEELPENGWGALIGAAAGVEHVRRRQLEHGEKTTRVTALRPDGSETWAEPRTESDERTLDGAINDYLSDAGISPRPAGYAWYLRRPSGWPAGRRFSEAVMTSLGASDALAPREVLTVARSILRTYYRS